jgi:DNA repair protein RecO (recombination protein O)
MERNITTLAIVLQVVRWGELHRKVSLLTPELGIIDVLVYGARKGRQAGKWSDSLPESSFCIIIL